MPGPNGAAVLGVGLEDAALTALTDETTEDLLGAIARLAGGGVDVVVLSLALPEGLEALGAIRERAPDVPVIALAGEHPERAIEAGASDVLPGDAPPALLERAIRYASSMRRMEAELHRRQVVDDLTGLYNARGFEQLARHHLALADRTKQPVILVFVALDALERDDAGVDADERERLVAETAAVLHEAVRASDVIARVGAGAFCVLLTGDATGAEALVLSRLVEAVAASNARSGRTAQLSLSVGTAAYDPDNPVPLTDLIAEADRQMRAGGTEP